MAVLPNISGLIARYRAEGAKVGRDGTLIEWPDEVGSNHLYVPTRHNYVTRSRRAFAGKDVLDFEGSGLTSTLSWGPEATVLVVASFNDRPDHSFYAQDVRVVGAGPTGVFLIGGHRGARPTPIFRLDGEAVGTSFTSGYRVHSFVLGSTPVFRTNGTANTLTGAVTGLTLDEFSLGGPGFHASVAEVIVYERALDASELDQIESYLEGEYGFSDPVPTAVIAASSQSPAPAEVVTLDGTGSTGSSLTYSWNILYPTTGTLSSTTGTSTDFEARNGVYYAELTVEDLFGQQAQAVTGVDVQDVPYVLPPEIEIFEAVSNLIVSSRLILAD